jgi:hypothetical protein
MTEVLVESKHFDEGEPVKVIMSYMVYCGTVTRQDNTTLYTTSGWFNLDAPSVKAYRIKEIDQL